MTLAPGCRRTVPSAEISPATSPYTSSAGQAVPAAAMGAQQEAVAALMALGYTSAEAARAINQVQGQADKTDQLIMLALRTLGGN